MVSLKEMIERAFKSHKDCWGKVVYSSLTEDQLQEKHHCDLHGVESVPDFLLWTTNRVYFKLEYDGMEWVTSVPRNPCQETYLENTF